MKAISLHQPWASAIALGKKTVETRHWLTHYRGPIAIHAAKIWTGEQQDFCKRHLTVLLHTIPLGAVVAVADLTGCERTSRFTPHAQEALWGNFAQGRFAWVFVNIRALAKPIPYKGNQGLWNLPDRVLA